MALVLRYTDTIPRQPYWVDDSITYTLGTSNTIPPLPVWRDNVERTLQTTNTIPPIRYWAVTPTAAAPVVFKKVSFGAPQVGPSFADAYDEISDLATPGLAANKANYLWAIDDGLLTVVIAINKATAASAGEWTITGLGASDVESMASFVHSGTGQAYLVIGDTGNNANAVESRGAGSGTDLRIARVKEPTITGSNGNIAVGDTEIISCAFPVANTPSHRDVECMIATSNGDIYFITKRITPILLYRLPYAASYSGVQTLEYMGALNNDATLNTISTTDSGNNGYVTGGAVSPDGKYIVLRSYTHVYGWQINTGETIAQTLARAPDTTNADLFIGRGVIRVSPYGEQQGEAVCFDTDSEGIYTASEKRAAYNWKNPALTYMPRVDATLTRASFQTGTGGYAGTTDTFVDSAAATTDNSTGANSTTLISDYNFSVYPTISQDRHGLLKFDITAIPTNATVVAAYLDLYCGAEGKGVDLHKIKPSVSWSATSTYNSLGGGIALDNVDANSAYSISLGGDTGESAFLDAKTGSMRIPLPIADVQDWVTNPSNNQGYVIKGRLTDTTGDGMQFHSSRHATAGLRPNLIIYYYAT